MSACPFKVGETYPDEGGVPVEIIHQRTDACDFPLIGIARWLNGSGVRGYTLLGRCNAYSYNGDVDLIPPGRP